MSSTQQHLYPAPFRCSRHPIRRDLHVVRDRKGSTQRGVAPTDENVSFRRPDSRNRMRHRHRRMFLSRSRCSGRRLRPFTPNDRSSHVQNSGTRIAKTYNPIRTWRRTNHLTARARIVRWRILKLRRIELRPESEPGSSRSRAHAKARSKRLTMLDGPLLCVGNSLVPRARESRKGVPTPAPGGSRRENCRRSISPCALSFSEIADKDICSRISVEINPGHRSRSPTQLPRTMGAASSQPAQTLRAS